MQTAFRYLLSLIGILLGVPVIGVLLLLPKTPLSFLGLIYLLAGILLVTGFILAPWGSGRSLTLSLIGGLLLLASLTARIFFPPSGSQVNLITLPGASGPRLLARILNERDAVLLGAWLGPYVHFITPAESEDLIPAFKATFQEMQAQGVTPLSPVLTTYLNQQSAKNFDVVVAEPPSENQPTTGILFLHGFGGNFTLQCWLIAEAGYQVNAVTVCPSTHVSGQWWTADGQAIVQESLTYLHQRGVQRVYLAGLSNGAIGTSRLAERWKADLAGLILISGADPYAAITGLPVLVIHGRFDERIPVSVIEAYVKAAGPSAAYHPFQGDHFLLLKQADPVQAVIASWLHEQEASTGKK